MISIDRDGARPDRMRPQALTSGYNPYGFVAHAFGAVDGLLYTNSLEAFRRNHARAVRVVPVT